MNCMLIAHTHQLQINVSFYPPWSACLLVNSFNKEVQNYKNTKMEYCKNTKIQKWKIKSSLHPPCQPPCCWILPINRVKADTASEGGWEGVSDSNFDHIREYKYQICLYFLYIHIWESKIDQYLITNVWKLVQILRQGWEEVPRSSFR